MAENNEEKKNDLLQVCLEYLERYYVLTSFTAFLFGPSFEPNSPHRPSFGEWSKQRPELQRWDFSLQKFCEPEYSRCCRTGKLPRYAA
jgi:hypothetical protein